ncbi:hypothetical protein DEU56DRAFT_909908 [Suillus clintonianus]|uniref:uncharacterized protein n=1 Tax=Suillus clintonianus TaxID=1904413 RepID=UPI001B85C932|nr:uncharacterized protein DEU56DRAFT_909908 [Suillus clintonianus]KAG2146228.1 hypothetical protein DEU56DRAFT_909908 [Suillus clintonianus]
MYHPGFQAGYYDPDGSQIGAQTRQTQYYPSSDDQRLPATIYNGLRTNIFLEPSVVPPPPVPAAGQSLSVHLATAHPGNLVTSSSFADRPLFSDPNSFATRERRDDYHSSVNQSGEGPPVSFPGDPSFHPNPYGFFEPHTSQYDHLFSGPSTHVEPVPSQSYYHPSLAACFEEVSHAGPQDVLSADGMCMVPAGFEDIPALNESLPPNGLHPGQPWSPLRRQEPVNDTLSLPTCQPGSRSRVSKPLEFQFHPYSRPAQLKLRGVATTKDIPVAGSSRSKTQPSRIGPSLYDGENRIHQRIFETAQESRIRSALNVNPFLFEQDRKNEALAALTKSASEYDKDFGKKWAYDNLGVFYKSNPSLSAKIMTTCKKLARPLVQRGYELRPSVWSRTSESKHQMEMVDRLVSSLPPEFIFGKDEFGRSWAFEHHVVLDVVVNTIVELGYLEYLTDLKTLFCTAAAAVRCCLDERSDGGFKAKDFLVSQFKETFDLLMNHIQKQIVPDVELSARWEEYQKLVFDTLRDICPQ